MKISEVIERLQAIKEEHGDLPVALADWNECYEHPCLEATGDMAVKTIREWNCHDKTWELITALVIGIGE